MHILYCFMRILQNQEREPHLSTRQFHDGFPRHQSCLNPPCCDHASGSRSLPASWLARFPNDFGVWCGQARRTRMYVRDLLEQKGWIIPWCTKLYHWNCKNSNLFFWHLQRRVGKKELGLQDDRNWWPAPTRYFPSHTASIWQVPGCCGCYRWRPKLGRLSCLEFGKQQEFLGMTRQCLGGSS